MNLVTTSKSQLRFTTKKTYKTAHIILVEKEYKVIKLMQKYDKLVKYLPQSIEIKGNILIYKYEKGQTAGVYLADFGYKSGLFTREKFNEFICFFHNLSKIKNKKLIGLAQLYDYNYALNELNHYKNNNPEMLSVKQWVQVFEKLKQNKQVFFNNANFVLSHFDMYPENVIMSNNDFKIIDWEGLSMLPSAFVPAFLSLLFWREKIWRDLSVKKFFKDNLDFHKSFSLFTVILSIRFIYQIKAYSQINDTNKDALNWFYKNLNTYISQDRVKVADVRFLLSKKLVNSLVYKQNLGEYITHKVYEKSFSNVLVYIKTSQ